MGLGIRLCVQLDAVRTSGFDIGHGFGLGIHEQAHPSAQVLGGLDQGAQTRLIGWQQIALKCGEAVDRDLARRLVQAGFVVAIPLHKGDNHRDNGAPGPQSWERRPAEVSAAIDAVAAQPPEARPVGQIAGDLPRAETLEGTSVRGHECGRRRRSKGNDPHSRLFAEGDEFVVEVGAVTEAGVLVVP
jgi:hypothetical protein